MGRPLRLTRDPERHRDSTPAAQTILYQGSLPRRRATLYELCDAGALSLESLADRVARRLDRRDDERAVDGASNGPEETFVSLYHNHLHHLSEAGLVVYDASTRVALHANVDESRVRAILQAGEGHWDALRAILSNERREHVVSVLESNGEPTDVDELATAVVALADAEIEGPQRAVRSASISLHHVDLPKLAEVGVVTYDHEEGRAELGSVPEILYEASNAANPARV